MITIKELAKRAGVSRGTVDRVLNGRPGVKPETEARVRALMDQLGYHPDQTCRMLAARGMPVSYLERRAEGGLTLGDLPRGQVRLLTQEERRLLTGDG